MRKIQLSQGKYAIVDDEDFDKVSQFKWSYDHKHARRSWRENGKRCHITMQAFIKIPDKGQKVIHLNGNTLDNRKSNLTLGNTTLVNIRRKLQSNNTTGYKGVSKYKNGKYGSSISVNNRRIHLGYYFTAEKAAMAYNSAAVKYWGKKARLNDVNDLNFSESEKSVRDSDLT